MTFEGIRSNERPYDRAEVVQGLIHIALEEIDEKYGVESPNPKAYHNRQHAEDFMEAAGAMADLAIATGKLETEAKDLLLLVGAYHDWEQDHGEENEEISAAALTGRMWASNAFSAQEILLAHDMIMITKVAFQEGILRHANTPNNLLTALAADADLVMLGRPPEVFWKSACKLLVERLGTPTPSKEQMVQFALEEVPFLEGHRFMTNEADELFPFREQNIDFVNQFIAESQAA